MDSLLNNKTAMPGIYRAIVFSDSSQVTRVYIPGIHNLCPLNNDGSINETFVNEHENCFPEAIFCAPNLEATEYEEGDSCWVIFETSDMGFPIIVGYLGSSIKQVEVSTGSYDSGSSGSYSGASSGTYNSILTESQILNMDIRSELPYLSEEQIKYVLTDSYFGTYKNSYTNKESSDILAKQLYQVQNETKISLLYSFGVSAYEVGWGRSVSAKNNYFNFGHNSSGMDLHYFDNCTNIAAAYKKYHELMIDQYYNKRGLKTIAEIGPTYDNASWSSQVASCIKTILKFIPESTFTSTGSTTTNNVSSGATSSTQQKIANYAKTFKGGQYGSGSNSAPAGRCQAWVEDVVYNVTGIEHLYASANEAGRQCGVSTNMSEVPLGACVWTIYQPNGHAAIYIGDGKVASNLNGNAPSIETIESFKSWASRKSGYEKMVWGWIDNQDLRKM